MHDPTLLTLTPHHITSRAEPTEAITALSDRVILETTDHNAIPLPNIGRAQQRVPIAARAELFPTWSTIDDAKSKAKALSDEAAREFEKASAKAQEKTGHIQLYSGKYYAACSFGGLLACGLTHTFITPLDLVKCRRQVDSKLYTGNFQAWGKIARAEGFRGIYTGWSPTFFGYSAQGMFKYGGYEYFKKTYSDVVGPEAAVKYRTAVYLAASASAEFIADIALCPFEAIKVRMQTSIPPFATGTFNGMSIITAKEGYAGLYKGLYPLWGRQIPYTMMKFASFETIVEAIYGYLPGKKSDYGKAAQTGVSFTGGYLAGILCAIISHPADVMVSKLNANKQPGEAAGAATARIYSEIGFRGLWNGLPVRIVMIGTLTGLQWMIYDYFKIFMGFPTTGGKKYCSWRKHHGSAIPHGLVDEDYELEAWCLIEDGDEPLEIPGKGRLRLRSPASNPQVRGARATRAASADEGDDERGDPEEQSDGGGLVDGDGEAGYWEGGSGQGLVEERWVVVWASRLCFLDQTRRAPFAFAAQLLIVFVLLRYDIRARICGVPLWSLGRLGRHWCVNKHISMDPILGKAREQ
ncbi:hypothetical protein V496_03384 [Pseudogymnoascus sp. VKM F-4515 (FW-2607)]|nr:hypothetical protein V496_03384 [Pseudogymnoascus sp. VKM F-4515 (FW-2607)]